MEGGTDWRGGWTDGRRDRLTGVDGQMEGGTDWRWWMDRWKEGQTDGVDGQMEGVTDWRGGWTDGRRERMTGWMDRWKEGQTDGVDGQMEGGTDWRGGWTDWQGDFYIPPPSALFAGDLMIIKKQSITAFISGRHNAAFSPEFAVIPLPSHRSAARPNR